MAGEQMSSVLRATRSYDDFPKHGMCMINNETMSVVGVYDDNYYKRSRFVYNDITLRRAAITANGRRCRKILLSIGPLCSLSVHILARVSSFVRKIIYETARKCTLSFRYSRKAFADSATIRTPQDLNSRQIPAVHGLLVKLQMVYFRLVSSYRRKRFHLFHVLQ